MRPEDAKLLRYLGLGFLLFLAVWFIYQVRDVLPLFVLAAILAYALDPILDRLEQRGWSRLRAAAFGFGTAFALVIILLALLIPILIDQIQLLSTNYKSYEDSIMRSITDFQTHWSKQFPQVDKAFNYARQHFQEIAPTMAAMVALWIRSQLPRVFTYLVILPLLTFYFMLDFRPLRDRVVATIPVDYRGSVLAIVQGISRMLGRYIRGQIVVCAAYALAATVYFVALSFVFGTNYALLLGVMTGVLAIIPFIGTLITAVVAGTLGYLTCDPRINPIIPAIIMPGGLLVINTFIDNVVTPKILGKETGLHPVTVIFSLMAGSQIAGIFGMIVAIPTAAAVKIILLTLFPSLRDERLEKKPKIVEQVERSAEMPGVAETGGPVSQ